VDVAIEDLRRRQSTRAEAAARLLHEAFCPLGVWTGRPDIFLGKRIAKDSL
jgi:hypothetical protein